MSYTTLTTANTTTVNTFNIAAAAANYYTTYTAGANASGTHINIGLMDPTPEMISAAEKLLCDPNFDVGKFLAKLLAKHLQDNWLEYAKDELISKYLPKP